MKIEFTHIKSSIKRHLSIIGKRLYNKDGKNLFSDITVSTAEEPIFDQYITSAAQNIEAALRQLVTNYAPNGTSITMTLTNTREHEDFDKRCEELANTYITFFSVGEYLAMVHPDLAEKYYRDANNSMQSLIAYAYHKNPPE